LCFNIFLISRHWHASCTESKHVSQQYEIPNITFTSVLRTGCSI
jgi:hypothetical protein